MKAKKATAGEKLFMQVAKYSLDEVRLYQPVTAKAVDRLIARERRKERERIVKGLQAELDNAHPHEHVNTRTLLAEVISDIRNGGQR